MSTFLIPFIIAIITAIITVLFTIHVKFATSKEEAIDSVKTLLFKGFIVCGVLITVYELFNSIISKEEVTHLSVFLIVYYSISLVMYLMAFVSLKILDSIINLSEAHKEHLSITKDMLLNNKSLLTNIGESRENQLAREKAHLNITQDLAKQGHENLEITKELTSALTEK